MKKLWAVIKQHYEFIAYIGLTILLFGSCFYYQLIWVTAGYIEILMLILRKETKLIALLLFLHCFYNLFNYNHTPLIVIITWVLMSTVIIQHLLRVIRYKQKINWKVLILVLLFLVYVALPFHECKPREYVDICFLMFFLCVVFEDRKQIDFCYITRVFAAGIIISCVYALFRNISPLLTAVIQPTNYLYQPRFQGLLSHPNILAAVSMIVICAMLVMKYKNQMSLIEFLINFIPIFMFGYLTLTRFFLITVFVGIVIFSIFYVVQCKAKSFVFLGSLLLITCLTACIFFNITKLYFQRIDDTSTEMIELTNGDFFQFFDSQPEEWKQAVWDGKILFDPGRSGLWKLYYRDWSSSQKNIWLGRGISRPIIGQKEAHNLFLQKLWEHGLIGYFFYVTIIICLIDWKGIKQKKYRFSCLNIIMFPYLFMTLIEPCLLNYMYLSMIMAACGFLENASNIEKKQDYNDTFKISA